jgi:hypothetical protein
MCTYDKNKHRLNQTSTSVCFGSPCFSTSLFEDITTQPTNLNLYVFNYAKFLWLFLSAFSRSAFFFVCVVNVVKF